MRELPSNRMTALRAVVMLGVLGIVAAPAGAALAAPKAPAVALKDVDGRTIQIDYKAHRLTLVNFWATWCLPCREEMPQIARLVAAHGGRGLQTFGIAMESGKAAEVKRFLKENPDLRVNYPILIGDDKAAARFGNVEVVPTTFLIDASGTIVRKYEGVTPDFFEKVGRDIRTSLAPAADAASP